MGKSLELAQLAGSIAVDSSGNIAVTGGSTGYGTGTGGTVTQATSKSTSVTLNKPTGQITMNNAALAAGAVGTFIFVNSYISAADNVVITASFIGGPYEAWVYSVESGQCRIAVRNNSGTSQSDAVVLNFAIIKGATS